MNSSCDGSQELPDDGRLCLLSFNIQVGTSTERYRHYLTRGRQRLLSYAGRATNLKWTGELLADYDLAILQEVDGGSLRFGHVSQIKHLAQLGAFPYWYQQFNHNLGRIVQHSNDLLSRRWPTLLEDHPLPSSSGRGAIFVHFGEDADVLVVVMMHLVFDARTHTRQLAYIHEPIGDYHHQVLMGDMNTHAVDPLENSPLRDLGLMAPQVETTFPS